MKPPFPFLSVREVAVACDLSDANIYKHIELGHIEVIKRELQEHHDPGCFVGGFSQGQSRGTIQASSEKDIHGQGG
jgi:hypothetical protein